MSEPEFIKLDGCINCETYKTWRNGKNQPHELKVVCLLLCNMQYSILNPFIGNHEIEEFIKTKRFPDSGKEATQEQIENAIKVLEKRRHIKKEMSD